MKFLHKFLKIKPNTVVVNFFCDWEENARQELCFLRIISALLTLIAKCGSLSLFLMRQNFYKL